MKETRMQRARRQHKELMNNVIEARQYGSEDNWKIEVTYSSGAKRTFKNEPSWFEEYIENAWSIPQNDFTVYAASHDYIKANYSPVELEAPVEEVQEAPVETSTPAEIADRATAEIFHIIDKMPENSGLEYDMQAIHVKPTNNNTFVVIADTKRFGKNQIMFESYDIMQCVEYVKNSIHVLKPETTPAAPATPATAFRINMQYFAAKQQYTSADTSINAEKVPTIFNTIINKADKLNINLNNTTIFDNGCGKYPEIISEKLNNYHAGYYGRDPYNQPEHINNMFPIFAMNCTDNRVFTSSNVLNVIPGLDNRTSYIQDIMQYMQAGEKLYITIYEGNKSGRGKVTKKDCWQENRKLASYIPEVKNCGFSEVIMKYGMIIATL